MGAAIRAVHEQVKRLLGGSERTPAQVLEVLTRADEKVRVAIGRELLVRSCGRVWLLVRLLPQAFARELHRLRSAIMGVDFGG